MRSHRRAYSRVLAAMLALSISACSDPTASPLAPPAGPQLSRGTVSKATSTVAWNETARDLFAPRGINAFVQTRILAYLSVAQYNAIVTAENRTSRRHHPSAAAAAAGASLVVLQSFFPLDSALLDATLRAQRADARGPRDRNTDFAAGEAIGRSIGAAVVAYAATDRYNLSVVPANPGGPGSWTGINSSRGGYGARPFALTSGDQFRPPPPPAFDSPEFTAALQEVRAFSDGLTPAQLAIAQYWAPKGAGDLNRVAAEMIVAYHRSEYDAARVLALANMAGFDVLNACFDAKLAYYVIRPSQADPLINVPVGLPNFPAYPSAHSCTMGAYVTVLARAFPKERDRLQTMAEEGGMSRMYAGLHYRFDLEAGFELGRQVARYVLKVAVRDHRAIPLD